LDRGPCIPVQIARCPRRRPLPFRPESSSAVPRQSKIESLKTYESNHKLAAVCIEFGVFGMVVS
jgi:hypothetical protein